MIYFIYKSYDYLLPWAKTIEIVLHNYTLIRKSNQIKNKKIYITQHHRLKIKL